MHLPIHILQAPGIANIRQQPVEHPPHTLDAGVPLGQEVSRVCLLDVLERARRNVGFELRADDVEAAASGDLLEGGLATSNATATIHLHKRETKHEEVGDPYRNLFQIPPVESTSAHTYDRRISEEGRPHDPVPDALTGVLLESAIPRTMVGTSESIPPLLRRARERPRLPLEGSIKGLERPLQWPPSEHLEQRDGRALRRGALPCWGRVIYSYPT